MGLTTLMIFRRPGVAAGMLFCTYGLEQWTQAKSMWFFTHGTITNYVTGALILLALGIAISKHKPILRRLPREYWVMGGLYVWALLTLMWSVNPQTGWENYRYVIPFLAIFGFLSPLIITDRTELKAMLYTLLTLGFVICALLKFTTEWNDRAIVFDATILFTTADRGSGNPLAVATLGAEVSLAALLMNFRGTARVWQILRYVVFGVGLALTVQSGSRGQAIALLALGLALYPFSRRFKDVKGFVGFAISMAILGTLVTMIFGALTQKAAVPGRWSLQGFMDAYSEGRLSTSLEMLKHWAEGGPLRWLLGLGSSAAYKWLGIYPHVVLVEVLTELGFVGVVFLILFTVFSVRSVRELWQCVKDDAEDRGLVVTLLGLYLFDIMMSFKQGSLLWSGTMFATGIMLARLNTFYRQEIAEYEALDAGGYAMSDEDRELELGDLPDGELDGQLEPVGA